MYLEDLFSNSCLITNPVTEKQHDSFSHVCVLQMNMSLILTLFLLCFWSPPPGKALAL